MRRSVIATNRYFNHLNQASEQNLFEDLVVEQIQLFGYNVLYIPRTVIELDNILGDPVKTIYEKAYQIEALLPDAGNFGGDQNIMSKFGFRQNQTAEFMIAKRRFTELGIPGYTQPRSGDLVFMGDLDNPNGSFTYNFFEINNVLYDYPGFEFGRQYCYKLMCENFTYSHEKIRSGFKTIDDLETPENPYSPAGQDGSANNDSVKQAAETLMKWDTGNPFGDF